MLKQVESLEIKAGIAGFVSLWAFVNQQYAVLYFIAGFIVLMDFVMGFLAAWSNGEVDSRFGLKGVLRKLGILTLPLFSILIDYTSIVLGQLVNLRFENPGILFIFTCVSIIGTEGSSFLANASRAGIPVPEVLTQRLAELNRKNNRSKKIKNEG